MILRANSERWNSLSNNEEQQTGNIVYGRMCELSILPVSVELDRESAAEEHYMLSGKLSSQEF